MTNWMTSYCHFLEYHHYKYLLVTTLLNLWALRLAKMKIKYFWFVTWPHQSATWLCGWVPLILSHHTDKFGVHRPCKSVTWPRDQSVAWLCRCGPFILSHNLAKFGGHGLCESGDTMLCICHMTWSMCHVTLWGGGFLILSAKFGVHRLYGVNVKWR